MYTICLECGKVNIIDLTKILQKKTSKSNSQNGKNIKYETKDNATTDEFAYFEKESKYIYI